MILALDQSTGCCGWALIDGNKVKTSGYFKVAGKADDTRGRVDLFKELVRDLVDHYGPLTLAWERPATFRSMRANVMGARLDEALNGLADELQLNKVSVSSSTWRAQVLGKGSGRLSSKDAKLKALEFCRWIGLTIRNADQAEACCIGLWAQANERRAVG